jgi:hypothetical protein
MFFFYISTSDGLITSYNLCSFVIPLKTGIQLLRHVMDPRPGVDDRLADFFRDHQKYRYDIFGITHFPSTDEFVVALANQPTSLYMLGFATLYHNLR